MLTPRYYQTEAVDALYAYFEENGGDPLVVMPTGTGKAFVIALFCQRAIADYSDTRIINVTDDERLIEQNYLELMNIWEWAPAGIYSAGLKSRNTHAQILFAGIQSVYKKAYQIQRCDLMLVDEAHMIGRKSDGRYQQFIRDMRSINPHMKVIGLTATHYRLDSGMLHEGDDRLFTDIAYEYQIATAIKDGFLAPVTSRRTGVELDTTGVAKRGGDFVPGALKAACDLSDVNAAIVRETIARGEDRRCWLGFATGISHAEHLVELLRLNGISCAAVHSKMQSDEAIRDFKAGKLRALVNVSMLTKGFNVPQIDMIFDCGPTQSAGRHVQKLGRGTRLFPGKADCLVLDYAKNCARHGPLDEIRPRRPGKGDGEAPVKECGNQDCGAIVHAAVRVCPYCEFEFPPPEPELSAKPCDAPAMSFDIQPEWIEVRNVRYAKHTKPGSPASLRVEYDCGMLSYSEWVCLSHTGYARQKAVEWWRKRTQRPVPTSTEEAIELAPTLPAPSAILVMPGGKYIRVIGARF